MTTRILHVIPTLVQGGAEKQLALLARQLLQERFDVHVCVLTHSGPLQSQLTKAGIPIHEINKSWKVDPGAYLRLKRCIQKVGPEIVHTWLFAANSYGRAAAFGANVNRIVAAERCVDWWKSWYEFAIDRKLAQRTDRIVTNSNGVRDFYAQHGIDQNKFSVIPNGIAPLASQSGENAGEYDSNTREKLFQKFNIPTNARIVGAVGRLWAQKNYKDLIWSHHLLDELRGDVHLVILGEGPERWRLERYARQVDLKGSVHFLGHREDVSCWIPHFDCFWLASSYEGQSNALMEAMQAGIPVVVSDIPGNRDLVVHEESGVIVPVRDRFKFAQQTNLLFEDAPLAERLGAAARKRMMSEFSVTKMVQRHVTLYNELTSTS